MYFFEKLFYLVIEKTEKLGFVLNWIIFEQVLFRLVIESKLKEDRTKIVWPLLRIYEL